MTDREVARMFSDAFDNDSIRQWMAATREWNDRPYVGRIGVAVKALRKAWYHDSSNKERNRCIRAAERLRDVLAMP